MRKADNLEFLEVWEKVHNPDFNLVHLKEVKKDLGKNRFLISLRKWIEAGIIPPDKKADKAAAQKLLLEK